MPTTPTTSTPLGPATPSAAPPIDPPIDPLAGLRDWHLPDPVSWWPPAPGWWLLGALALGVLAYALLRWYRHRRQGAAVRAARAELRVLRARLGAGGADGLDPAAFAAAVSVLLRRLALTRAPRARVAGLCGEAWLDFLDATGGGGAFVRGPGRLLADLPFRNPTRVSAADAVALADLADRWLRVRPANPAQDSLMTGGHQPGREPRPAADQPPGTDPHPWAGDPRPGLPTAYRRPGAAAP